MNNGAGDDVHPRKEQVMGVFGFGRASVFKVILDGSNRRQIQWKAIWAAGVA